MSDRVRTAPGGTANWTYDAGTNDSDKTYTVPANKKWELIWAHVELTATATVGNRSLKIQIGNGSAVVLTSIPVTVTASQVGVVELGDVGLTTTVGNCPTLAGATPNAGAKSVCNRLLLPAGYTIRFWDSAAVDAAADDMIISFHYTEYEA